MTNIDGEKRVRSNKKPRNIILLAVALVVAVVGWACIAHFRGLLRLGYVDSAIGTVRTLVAEESHFAEAHPDIGYACKMSDLGSNLGSNEMIRELVKNRTKEWIQF